MKFEIRFDIEVGDNETIDDVYETIQSVLSFGADESIDDHVSYNFDTLEVIPK